MCGVTLGAAAWIYWRHKLGRGVHALACGSEMDKRWIPSGYDLHGGMIITTCRDTPFALRFCSFASLAILTFTHHVLAFVINVC